MTDTLTQPLFSRHSELSHAKKEKIGLKKFLELLRQEEEYYPGEQGHTRLMLTRLRKIFYDQ